MLVATNTNITPMLSYECPERGTEKTKKFISACLAQNQKCMSNRVYCIHVPGHDPITFSFRSFSFLIGWGFYGPII